MDFDDKSMIAPIIPVHLPAAFVRMCVARGYSISAILENSGIKAEDLDSIDTYFSLNQISKFVQNALILTKDPSISIAFSQYIRLSHFGSFGIALMSAPTLNDVFVICKKYSSLIDPTISFESEIKDSTICIKFGKQIPLGLNYYYTQEALCLSIIRIISDLVEHELPQLRIELDYAKPSYAEKFNYLNAPISWNKRHCAIYFNTIILDKKLPGADLPAFQKALRMCEAELSLFTQQGENWLIKLKLMILQNLQKPLTAEEMAEQLHLSRRTFFRKLAEYDTTYDALLSTSRAEVAKDYLLYKKTSLIELADHLGYNDVSNFTKAFKRWYGLPPKQWLQSQLSRSVE
ncbi:AraC family transcriptional regulator [Acinetobacter pragensis]|uniref:HTH araC/xylS-type domain-containing protein n=1 Tax=Acinetobacter pragensis TaxID=1806892 RepID=A0A151Y4A0_9GAMM|nr:AraC family transcriptional regulator [Acinetobacter pragensis]KYQ72787.1 hypothetical protein AZH43_07985 [Acinetobacter pragensis]